MLSSMWFRVAGLRPRLRPHARLHRHRYRGRSWWLLEDRASGRVHRFAAPARLLVAAMDGTRTVDAIWQAANKRLGEDAPSQDEVIQLLGQLHAADLLQSDVMPDAAELFARGERDVRARARQSFANPMALRLALWDPDRMLDRIGWLCRFVWSRWGLLLWLAVVGPALILVPAHWPELTNDLSDRVLAVDNLLILYVVFPVLKALHELGHASAAKAGRSEVHDMGVMLLVLLPVPYVEASSATVFRSKWRRATVGAAGMATELFAAALAFYVWLEVEPGLVRAVLFNVMLIAGVSTLLFNGNPLLRYDAYYILADLIEIPNLGIRASRFWLYVLDRHVLGASRAERPEATPGEAAWLLAYGLASCIYRIVVTVLIALFIAGKFFFIGVALALWAVASLAVMPVVRVVRYLVTGERLRPDRWRAVATAGGAALALAGFLLLVPVPSHTQAEGVVWLPEQALVRAAANGFLDRFVAEPGAQVAANDPLIQSSDPALASELRMTEARVAEYEASYAAESTGDRGKARVAAEKLMQERTTLGVLQGRAADLLVRAGADGTFQAPQSGDMPGRYYRKGDLLGYVIGDVRPLVRAVVPQDAIDRVRGQTGSGQTGSVLLRRVDRPGEVHKGRIARMVPGGDEFLPSRALAIEGGGEVATDPRETKGPKALRRVFQVDIEPFDDVAPTEFGQRVYIRFQHAPEPLATQAWRSLRLLFLSRFGV